jgi:hypothetical protein
MVLLRRRSVFAAKLEATVGAAENLTNAEGVFNARDFSIVPSIPFERREGQGGFNHIKSVPGAMQATCTITHDLQYDGTNVPTWASVLLPACGWVNTAGVFAPMSRGPGTTTSVPRTITLGHYFDGKRRRIAGAMGTFVINLPTGQTPTITFTFTGKYFENESDETLLAPSYPTQDNLRFANGSLTWAAANICTANLSIDAGNEVIMRECVNASDRTGFVSALVTNRAPIITADPESVLVATANREQQWINGTTGALTATINGPGNSTLVISAPAAQLENNQPGDRNNMIIDSLTWLATRATNPDEELTITFNALTP